MFDEDLSVYFDSDSGFADPFTVNGNSDDSYHCLFDNDYVEYGAMAGYKPTMLIPSASYSPTRGDAIVINNKDFTVAHFEEPDSGTQLIILEAV